MAGHFNPYQEWLGIRGSAPPNHYQLLGLPDFEADPERIWAAVHGRRALLLPQQDGQNSQWAAKLLGEVDEAERCLLNPARKQEYDAHLRSRGVAAPNPAAPLAQGAPALPADEGQAHPPRRQTAWGYDDDAPLAARAPGGAPAAGGWEAPMRPEDFLPPPAAGAGYGLAPAPYAQPPPMAAPAGQAPGYGSPEYAAPAAPLADPYYAGQPPMAEIPTAAPVYPSTELPLAQPMWGAEVPVAQPLGPAGYGTPMEQIPLAAPVPAASRSIPAAAAAQAAGPVLVTRPKRARPPHSSNLLLAFVAPLAGIVIIGLLALYLAEIGPFSSGAGKQHIAAGPEKDPEAPDKPTTNVPPPKPKPLSDPADPVPEPTERPKPRPMPEPKPKPDPSPMPPKVEPKRNELVSAALMSARYWLAQRDIVQAKAMVDLAKKNDTEGAQSKEITPVAHLVDYVDQFWKAVREYCKTLKATDEITIPDPLAKKDIIVAVVEIGPEYIILRRAGRNEKHVFKEMKSGLAFGLAKRYLKQNDAATHIVLGAFLAVNSNDELRAQAREQWETALRLGNDNLQAEVQLLLGELDVSIPDQPPKLPVAKGEKDKGPPKPSGDGRSAPPQGDVLAKVQAAFDAKYKQQLAGAVFEADKAALAAKLKADAESEGMDAALRYRLVTKASELAAEAGNFKLALEAIDALEKTHAVNALALKVKAITAGVKAAGTAEASKAAAMAALSLADEAVLMEKYAEALQLAVQARTAARTSKDSSLLKQASARENEIKALKNK